MMKIVSWNINGGPFSANDRLDKAWEYLRELDPDVALIQEARRLPDWLPTDYSVLEETQGVGMKTAPFASLILVRRAFTVRPLRLLEKDKWLANLEGYVVTAEVDTPDGEPALIASVHAPPDFLRPEYETGRIQFSTIFYNP